MNIAEPSVRVATLQDAKALLTIYAPYVTETAITFEYTVPALSEFEARMKQTLVKYPYLVIEAGGEIQGYAYAGAFVGRQAYDRAAETTIYLKKGQTGTGLGGKLYGALEQALKAQNITNLYACIGYPETEDEYLTGNSAQFHAHLGYRMVGEFHRCGYKFGRWYNMVWMEKMIAGHAEQPLPVIPFPELAR